MTRAASGSIHDALAGSDVVKPALSSEVHGPLKPSPPIIRHRSGNGVDVVTGNTGHVLFVDGDPTMRQLVTNFFEERNIPIRAVANRQDLGRHFAISDPSLIILDLCLAKGDGLVPLQEIRSRSDVPIIITTSGPCEEINRVIALELGADDLVTKPFSLRELLARARAVLRRQGVGRTALACDSERGGFRFGGWQLDRRARRLLDPKGEAVSLTKGEYLLLVTFLEAAQRPLSREHLRQATRIHEDTFDRSIDSQVLRLRRKLETKSSAPRIIETQRGVGYLFALPVDPY
jgi:two-component system OmpR family response regulator